MPDISALYDNLGTIRTEYAKVSGRFDLVGATSSEPYPDAGAFTARDIARGCVVHAISILVLRSVLQSDLDGPLDSGIDCVRATDPNEWPSPVRHRRRTIHVYR